jgi:hypothetical protein
VKRSVGRIAVMTFDLGTQVCVGMKLPATDVLARYRAMREPVKEPYGPPQIRAAVRRLIPKFRAYLESRHARQ